MLVNGASGGVGRFVVQLLARRGIEVVATGTAAHQDRLTELGAKAVVDFTAGPVADQVRALYPDGVDGLVSLVGWSLEDVPVDVVRPGGSVSTTTQVPDDDARAARGLSGGGVMASPDRGVIAPLVELAAAGDLQVDVQKVLTLDQAIEGLSELEAGRAEGKLVVDLSLEE